MGLYEVFNEQLKKRYGRTCSVETFRNFVNYCRTGIEENGVKPRLNPINLYAYGTGITSEDAKNLIFEPKEDTP